MNDDPDFLAPPRRRPTRPSKYVDRASLPDVARRDEIVRRLRVHDPHGADFRPFTSEDYPVLRRIALEETLVQADPWVRRHAISELAADTAPESLNVLSLLARSNPDVAVRVEAVFALARTGIAAMAPIVAAAASSRLGLESAAGERALRELAARAGVAAVGAALPRNRVARRWFERLDLAGQGPSGEHRSDRNQTTADDAAPVRKR